MASVQNTQEKAKKIGFTCINPTPCARILHPILHPKFSVNTGHLVPWCRKCRRFSKTFFVEERERLWSRGCKTSDFFGTKYGCFAPKVRMFCSKSTDVFIEEVRCFCFPERTLHSKAVFQLFFRGHRHHVRMHIIYKAFFTLATWRPHYWLESLNLEWSMKACVPFLWLSDFQTKDTKGLDTSLGIQP